MLALLATRRFHLRNYESLKMELQNQYDLGSNQNPTALTSAAKILQHYVGTKGATNHEDAVCFDEEEVEGVNFLRSEDKPMRGDDVKIHPNTPCYNCRKKSNHNSNYVEPDRDEETDEAAQIFQVNDAECLDISDSEESTYNVSFLKTFCLTQKIKGAIPWCWVILDTCSSASMF